MREESSKPCKNGGWLHSYDDTPFPVYTPPARPRAVSSPKIDCGALMAGWRRAGGDARLDDVANTLGVTAQSLLWLGATWAENRQALAVPMYDATCANGCHPCGIRLRTMDGTKFAVTGSRSGIFLPYGVLTTLSTQRIFVCEGPSDTASCLDMGIFAVGRASCRGGEDHVLAVIKQLGCTECVIVSDNDSPGQAGALALMEKIRIRKTRIVLPGKDLRGFRCDGGNKNTLDVILKNMVWKNS